MDARRGSLAPLVVIAVVIAVCIGAAVMLFGTDGAGDGARANESALAKADSAVAEPDVAPNEQATDRVEHEQAPVDEPKPEVADPNAIPPDATGVSGRVIGRDGKPVKAVKVEVVHQVDKKSSKKFGVKVEPGKWNARYARSATTGDDGRFTVIDLIANGGYTIEIRTPDGMLGRKDGVQVDEKQVTDAGDVALKRGILVSGVVRSDGGLPIGGAEVMFGWDWDVDNPILSDKAGKYATEALYPGRQQVRVKASGYALREMMQREFVEGDRIDDFDLTLVQSAPIRGRVVDDFGKAVSDAWVNCNRQNDEDSWFGWYGDNMQTDAEGRFAFESMSAGTYQVSCNAQGYRGASKEDVVAGGEPIELVMKRACRIEGQVVDAGTNEPVKADHIQLLWKQNPQNPNATFRPFWRGTDVEIQDDGTYSIALNEGGTFLVEASADGYSPSRSTSFELKEGNSISNILVQLERGIELTVTVLDKEKKTPIAGAAVSVRKQSEKSNAPGSPAMMEGMFVDGEWSPPDNRQVGRKITDAEGKAHVKSMTPGKFTVSVDKVGYCRTQVKDVDVQRGSAPAPVEALMGQGGGIQGVVKNTQGAVETALNVFATGSEGQRGEAVTDESGHYVVEHLAPGRYKIRAPIDGQGEYDESSFVSFDGDSFGYGGVNNNEKREVPIEERFPIVVEDGKVASHDVTVERIPPGALAGTVMMNGSPFAGVEVMANPVQEGGNGFSYGWDNMVKTDERGAFKFRRLKPGKYQIQVSRSWSKQFRGGMVEIASNAESQMTIDLSIGWLSGRVVDQDGRPIAHVNINLNPKQQGDDGMGWGSHRNAETDGDGNFVIQDVQAGTYMLNSYSRGYRGENRQDLVVAGRRDAGPLELKLVEGGWLKVRVDGAVAAANTRYRLTLSDAAGNNFMNTSARPGEDGFLWADCQQAKEGTVKVTMRVGETSHSGSASFKMPDKGNPEVSVRLD